MNGVFFFLSVQASRWAVFQLIHRKQASMNTQLSASDKNDNNKSIASV